MREIRELEEISKYAGMREDLAQAGGGNASVKLDGQRMVIKASGVQLADVTKQDGYAIVDYTRIRDWMEEDGKGDTDILEQATIEGGRPSIETFLHAITGRVTLHTHPTSVCVLASRSDGMERLARLFPGAILVGYATPGADLARRYHQAYIDATPGETAGYGNNCYEMTFLKEKSQQDFVYPIIFLKNHGLVISGETVGDVVRMTEQVNETAEREVGIDNSAYRIAYEIYQWLGQVGSSAVPDGEETVAIDKINLGKVVVRVESRHVLEAYDAFGYRLWDYQICPDCIVFCGRKPFDYDAPDRVARLRRHLSRYGMPVLVTSGKDIFVLADSVRKAREIEAVLALSARVALANKDHDVDVLSDKDQDFLLGWDAEKYRQKI